MTTDSLQLARLSRGPRLAWLLVIPALVGFGPATIGGSSAPSNDAYADAAVVGTLPFVDIRDVSGATAEPLETVPSCRSNPPLPRNLIPNSLPQFPTVWYRFEPAADVQVMIDPTASDFATGLAVYEGDDLVTQEEVACADGAPLTVGLTAGVSYAIQILNNGGGSTLELTISEIDLPGVAEILPFAVLADDPDPLGRDVYLRGHVYLPEGEGPFAPVLEYSPYWNTAYGPSESFTEDHNGHVTMALWLRPLMDAGFAVALVNWRGTGESGGCMQWGGPVDSSDVATVIEALAAAEWSTGKVGMYGSSFPGWGQMLALAAADAPSLKAVVPVSPITDPWSVYTANGATLELEPRRPVVTAHLATGVTPPGWRQTSEPFVPDTEPGHATCPRFGELIVHSRPVWNGDRTEYFQQRDLRPLIEGTKVAVFATVGLEWVDGPDDDDDDLHISQLDGVWDLLGPHRRFMLGQWPHGFPTRPDFDEMAVAWLDQYLRGGRRGGPGAVKAGVVEYQDDAGVWHSDGQWPPRAEDATLWLSGGDLVTHQTQAEASSRTFVSSDQVPCAGFCVSGDEMCAGGICRRPSQRLPGCVGDHLVYVSEPLAEEAVIAGHYTVDLTIESSMPDGTLASFLYHTDADDPCAAPQLAESGQAIGDLRHVFTDEGADFPVDTPTDITLTSLPLASRIPAGHRLVLTVGSAGWKTERDPFRPQLTVTTGPGTISAVTLPIVSGSLATTD